MKNYRTNKNELKKHVSTIHCTNSLSLLQRKIANALLFHAYDDLLLLEEYEISVRELCDLIAYDSHDYKGIKRALIDLLSTVVEWNILEEGLPESEGEWNASSIIADASIKGSICRYSYSKRMKKLLYMPAIYGRLNMQIQSRFKSSYGLALYENVVRYQNLNQTPWFDLQVFKKLMGVNFNKYSIFRDFKRRVIDKAVEEVNSIADLKITPEFKRVDRNVAAIRFLLEKVQRKNQVEAGQTELSRKLHDDFGLNDKQIKNITARYEAGYVLEKIRLIESSNSFHAGKIVNLGKYLLHALEDNYQTPKSSPNGKQVKLIRDGTLQKKQPGDTEKQTRHKKAYQKYLDDYLARQLEALSLEAHQKITREFDQYIQPMEILRKIYQREGLENKIIYMEFKNFIKTRFSDLLQNAVSFEDFLKNTGHD